MSKFPDPREGIVYRASASGAVEDGDEMPWSEFLVWAALEPKRVHIVSMFFRPRLLDYLAAVERRLFPSDTILETALYVHATVWKGFPWNIQSVPETALESVRSIAAEYGFDVRHTVPVAAAWTLGGILASLNYQLDDAGWEWFPLRLPNVFTVEADRATEATRPGSAPRGGWG